MLPSAASQLFAAMSAHCAPGSRLVASLSDVKLRDLLRRYGHTTHLVEEFEPPGIVLNRICAAGRGGEGGREGMVLAVAGHRAQGLPMSCRAPLCFCNPTRSCCLPRSPPPPHPPSLLPSSLSSPSPHYHFPG